MSILKTLDEYTDAQLVEEMVARIADSDGYRCTYCHRGHDTSPCKFPERHRGLQSQLFAVLHDALKAHYERKT
jgi:hypothetical protein